jgi:hypothetical protein
MGAVSDAVARAMGGMTVNQYITPSGADTEAVARRVAFILGGSRVRMGGGF